MQPPSARRASPSASLAVAATGRRRLAQERAAGRGLREARYATQPGCLEVSSSAIQRRAASEA